MLRLYTYFDGSSSELVQTIGPSTEGASLSGAEPNEELLRRDSVEDFALIVRTDIVAEIMLICKGRSGWFGG